MRITELFEELCAILEVLKYHIKKLERENKQLKIDIKKIQQDINTILEINEVNKNNKRSI